MARSPLLYSTALALILTAPAKSQEITLWDFLSADRIGEVMVQSAINAARGFAEVRFHDLDIRPLDGHLALTGVTIRPYDDDYPDCDISVDGLTVTSHPLLQTQVTSVRIQLREAIMPVGCLDPLDRDEALAMGFEVFNINSAVIHAEYTIARGALEFDFHVVSDGYGIVTGDAVFDYAAINFDDEEPVLDLTHATVSITNDGLWERLVDEFPPFLFNAEMLTVMLEEELLDSVAPPPPPSAETAPPAADGAKPGDAAPAPATPTPAPAPEVAEAPVDPAVRAFIDNTASTVEAFANDPTRISITLAPDTPVRVSEETVEEFSDFVANFSPALSHGAPAPTEAPAEIAAALVAFMDGRGGDLDSDTRLALAEALFHGHGVPRNTTIAGDVLTPLLEAGDGRAVDMILDHPNLFSPGDYYETLLTSAGDGNRAAYLSLNAAEQQLSVAEMLAAQGATAGSLTELDPGAPADGYVDLAQAALLGLGTPRSYEQAFYYALMGESAGAPAASALVDQMIDMGRLFDDPEAWTVMLGETGGFVMADWVRTHSATADPEADPEATDSDSDASSDQ